MPWTGNQNCRFCLHIFYVYYKYTSLHTLNSLVFVMFIHFCNYCKIPEHVKGFLGGSDSKESACNMGNLGLIHGLGRSPGGGHDNPLEYSCWRILIDRGDWRLQSVGSQRVGHNWATKHDTAHSMLMSNLLCNYLCFWLVSLWHGLISEMCLQICNIFACYLIWN